MKIAVFGASGMVGSRVAAEAVSRGHEVAGATRSGGEVPDGVRAVQASANDVAAAKELAADADGPDFPAEYKGESLTVSQALENLRASDVNWTMLSPAFVIAPGERTGVFR